LTPHQGSGAPAGRLCPWAVPRQVAPERTCCLVAGALRCAVHGSRHQHVPSLATCLRRLDARGKDRYEHWNAPARQDSRPQRPEPACGTSRPPALAKTGASNGLVQGRPVTGAGEARSTVSRDDAEVIGQRSNSLGRNPRGPRKDHTRRADEPNAVVTVRQRALPPGTTSCGQFGPASVRYAGSAVTISASSLTASMPRQLAPTTKRNFLMGR